MDIVYRLRLRRVELFLRRRLLRVLLLLVLLLRIVLLGLVVFVKFLDTDIAMVVDCIWEAGGAQNMPDRASNG